jgi:hypothetical protein
MSEKQLLDAGREEPDTAGGVVNQGSFLTTTLTGLPPPSTSEAAHRNPSAPQK